MAGLAACGGDEPTAARPPAAPAPAPFQPQPVEVTLGASGEKVTLMTTQDGGFTLNGEAFESGKTVTGESGNVYTLLLADGTWNARYDAHEVEVKLGSLEETVKLVKGEDGSYMLGEMAVESGVTKHTSANGNVYTLVMGEDGMWTAQYQATETMLALGTSGTTVTIVRNEDGTYTVGGEPLMSGGTWTAANGGEYTLMMGEDGMWMSTFQPQMVDVPLGATGETVTLMTTEDGGFTLNGEAFESGGTVKSESGNMYTLLLADGAWNARYDAHDVKIRLGGLEETVTLVRGEDGSYMLGEMAVESGVTMYTAANGNVYTLVMGEDGMWMAQYQAPETMLALGTSGTTVTIVRNEDGTYTVGGEPLMSGGTRTASNGNEYMLMMGEDGMWTATYVPMTMEVQGTGGLQAVKREDGTGYDVDGAMLGMDGMGDIETETSGWYRVVMQDGALMGTRLDNVAVRNPTRFKTDKLSAHPSILGDDRKTDVNEARTALVVAGENYPFGDLLGDGVSQRKGKNFVAEARGKLLEIREKIVAVLDVFDTDSQRDTQVGRQWGTESANNATTNVKGVLETVFGKNKVKGKYAARRPDDDDALGVIDDLIEALGSAEALEQALGDEDLLKGSAGASKAGTIFAAAETESTVTYEAHGNTRYGTITRTKRTNAAEDLKYDDGTPQTGERGAFAFGVAAETSRTRYVQTAGTARYEGRTLAVSGAEKQYSGDIEVSVNFTASMVDGLITDLATGAGESWEYLFGEVDSIRLPTVKMTSQGQWEAKDGMASIGFGRRAGVYRPQSVASTFKGRLLGGNSAPGAGSEVVGVWSLGSDSKSTSYLAGGFGAERVADEPVRRPSVGDGTQVGAMLSSDNTVLENGQITLKPEQFDWLHGEFKVIAGQTGFAQDKTRTRKLRFARGKSGTDDPNARRTVKIALADVIDTEGGEYSKNSPKTHVQVAREEIQAQRDKIAGLQEIGNLQANINEAWTRALGSLQKNIFTDDSYYEFTGSSHTQSRTNLPAQTKASPTSGNWWQKLPTKVVDSAGAGGDGAQLVAPDDVLERLDAVLMALGTSEALADAFDPSADGTFAVNDSNGVEKSFLEVNKSGNLSGSKLTDPAKIFNESQWQVKVAVGSTDYTRFGVWRSQVSRNAVRDRDWWNRDMESYAYSALPAAEARTQEELPNGTRATYTGKTVAYVGTAPYEGEARFEVQWYSHTEDRTQRTNGKEVGAKSMVAVLTDVRNVNTGDYLYHKGKEVRQMTFFRGEKNAFSTDAPFYDKSKPTDADGARENDPTNHVLDYLSTFSGNIRLWQQGNGWDIAIDYRDSSETPDKAYPILYQVLFVGRSPDGPLGVMGRYEFVTEFNGNKVANFQAHNRFGTTKAESEDVTKSLRVVGAFGADLP